MAKLLADNPRSLRSVYLVAMFVAVAAALYCGALAAQQKDLPKLEATALWSHLQQQNYQKTFKQYPGKQPFTGTGAARHAADDVR
jgi:hypothetical protein